jgi:hypothetical protein
MGEEMVSAYVVVDVGHAAHNHKRCFMEAQQTSV